MLFKDAARRFLELHEPTWKNEKHRWQWGQTLEAHAFPTLGARPIAAIDGALITEALRPIWQKMPETARRTKQRIERVVQWVKDGMPLPAHGASKPPVRHHPALPFGELPALIAEPRARAGISARELAFPVLTAARTSDTLGAIWDEIDLDEAVWTIPAERMKSPRPHRVPLSREAVALLRDLPRVKGNKHVFPGARASRNMVRDAKSNDVPVDDHLFKKIGKELAIGSTSLVKRLYASQCKLVGKPHANATKPG
jgi:integrase